MTLPTPDRRYAAAVPTALPDREQAALGSRQAVADAIARPSIRTIDRAAVRLVERLQEQGADLNGRRPTWFQAYEKAAAGEIPPVLATDYPGYTVEDFANLLDATRRLFQLACPSASAPTETPAP